MTKINVKDIYKFILKVLPVSPEGDLLVDVETGKKVTLSAPNKTNIVNKTAGILKMKTTGVQFENKLRRQAEKRLKKETVR